jgi:RNA polymerase subunit RPABC4/transcription elongation factor Spt4
MEMSRAGGCIFRVYLRCATLGFMESERNCAHCHAILAADTQADWCPACGGSLIEPVVSTELSSKVQAQAVVVDHRGIVLPPRHALGGIITPR